MTDRKIDLGPLSDDAKAVAGGWFGMMLPGKGELTFMLSEGRPSDRAQAALDELVRAKVIAVEPYNDRVGLRYQPLVDCREAFRWMSRNKSNRSMTFRLVVDIANRAEANKVRAEALRAVAA